VQQIVDTVPSRLPARARWYWPLVRHRRGEHAQVFETCAPGVRVRVDGEVREIEEPLALDRYKWHDIDVVVDRLAVPQPDEEDDRDARRQRTSDSVEQALKLGQGVMVLATSAEGGWPRAHVLGASCPTSNHPRTRWARSSRATSSFNRRTAPVLQAGSRHPDAAGRAVSEQALSICRRNRALQRMSTTLWYRRRLAALADAYGFSVDQPLRMDERQWRALMHARRGADHVSYESRSGRTHSYRSREGRSQLARRHRETTSEWARATSSRMTAVPRAVRGRA
jgi:excinuclease ABC subunit A